MILYDRPTHKMIRKKNLPEPYSVAHLWNLTHDQLQATSSVTWNLHAKHARLYFWQLQPPKTIKKNREHYETDIFIHQSLIDLIPCREVTFQSALKREFSVFFHKKVSLRLNFCRMDFIRSAHESRDPGASFEPYSMF